MTLLDGFEHFTRKGEPLGTYTWLRLGGPAEYFAEPTRLDELQALVHRCYETKTPVRVLGAGSNVLVRDAGMPGMLVLLSAPTFCQVEVEGQRVIAGGGAKLAHLISNSVREGLSGLEQLVGIPGTVGGALHGNAGTQSGDIGQWTRSATVMTRSGELVTHQGDDLHFAYRQSSLDELAIIKAEFELDKDDPGELTERMQKLWIVRKSKQPMDAFGYGWIFKDPVAASAASLIEQAGLKGTRVGEAEISDRNANFVVVNQGATSDDVIRLIELMETRVEERLGVELQRDIEIR